MLHYMLTVKMVGIKLLILFVLYIALFSSKIFLLSKFMI